jgi:hypothetical protein
MAVSDVKSGRNSSIKPRPNMSSDQWEFTGSCKTGRMRNTRAFCRRSGPHLDLMEASKGAESGYLAPNQRKIL